MAQKFASAKYTIAECDRCGFRYKLRQLKEIFIRARNPRPDNSFESSTTNVGSRVFQWGFSPVGFNDNDGLTPNDLKATGQIGSVTVTTS